MPPKKKKAGGGDPAKGEKVFKNLCSACHSLSVRQSLKLNIFSLTRQAPPLEVSVEQTSPREKALTTHQHWLPRQP